MNFIILYACEIILKMPIKIFRTLFSSLIGSIYAVLLYISDLQIYTNSILKIVLSFVMVYIAFTPKNIKSFFKGLIVFYLTSFTFGGVTFAFIYFVNTHELLIKNRCINRNISNKNNYSRRIFWIYTNNYSI